MTTFSHRSEAKSNPSSFQSLAYGLLCEVVGQKGRKVLHLYAKMGCWASSCPPVWLFRSTVIASVTKPLSETSDAVSVYFSFYIPARRQSNFRCNGVGIAVHTIPNRYLLLNKD